MIEPEGTFMIWLDFRKLGFNSPADLTKFLKEQARWSVNRGESFGVGGEGFARVNIGCAKAKLVLALLQLKKAVICRANASGVSNLKLFNSVALLSTDINKNSHTISSVSLK